MLGAFFPQMNALVYNIDIQLVQTIFLGAKVLVLNYLSTLHVPAKFGQYGNSIQNSHEHFSTALESFSRVL